MRVLRWELRAVSDPRFLDTAILRLAWTLEALRDAEMETARALVAGLHGEWEHLRDSYTWRVSDKRPRS